MTADQQDHSDRHEQGGSDELDVSGLSGVLADAQTPQTEAVQDIVGALVTGGTNVTVTYDDANDVLTVGTSGLNTEEVEDAVGALVTAGNAITVNYDDGNDTLSIGVDESALSFYDGTNLTADVDNQSVSTEEVNNTLHVGPGGRYATLSAAFNDITDASASNRYRLRVSESITDDASIIAKSHIDVDLQGNTVEVTGQQESAAVWTRNVQDAVWKNGTIKYRPESDPGESPVFYIRQDCYQDFVLRDLRLSGHDQGDFCSAIITRHHSMPTFENVTAIGGDGGQGAKGFLFRHNSAPICHSCTGYGGDGGNSADGWKIEHSASPILSDCVGVPGANGTGHAIDITGSAAPEITGFTGRYRTFTNFVGLTGSGSDVVDSGFPIDQNESELAFTGGFDSFLVSIHIRIVNPVSGATIDVGTTNGGSEIASGVDASSAGRSFFDFNPVEFSSGDEIYFTATDSNVEFNPRYVVGLNSFNQESVYIDTHGPTTIVGSQFTSAPKTPAGVIGSNSTDSKSYVVSNSTFRRKFASEVGRSTNALNGQSDSGAADPIGNCTIVGSVSNINGSNNAQI